MGAERAAQLLLRVDREASAKLADACLHAGFDGTVSFAELNNFFRQDLKDRSA